MKEANTGKIDFTLEQVDKLVFFQRCISEVLRKEPTIGISSASTVSEVATIGGVTLNPGE